MAVGVWCGFIYNPLVYLPLGIGCVFLNIMLCPLWAMGLGCVCYGLGLWAILCYAVCTTITLGFAIKIKGIKNIGKVFVCETETQDRRSR